MEEEFEDLIQHAKRHIGFNKKQLRTNDDVQEERFDNRMSSLSGLLTKFGASADDLDDVKQAKKQNKQMLDDIISNIAIRVGLNAESFDILSPDYLNKLKESGLKNEEVAEVAIVETFLESESKELTPGEILQLSLKLQGIGIDMEPAKISNFVNKTLTEPANIRQVTSEIAEIVADNKGTDLLKKEISVIANTCLNRLQVKWRKISPVPIEEQYSNTKKDLIRTIHQIIKDEEALLKKAAPAFLAKKIADSTKSAVNNLDRFLEMELDMVYIKFLYSFLHSNVNLADFNKNIPSKVINDLFSFGINQNNPEIQDILANGIDFDKLKQLKKTLDMQLQIKEGIKTPTAGKRFTKKLTDAQNQIKLMALNAQKEMIAKAKKGDLNDLATLYWLKKSTLNL